MLDAHVVKARARFDVDITVRLEAGEACGLFGASGTGKSTFLSCVAGAETADGGRVVLDDVTLFPPPLPLHRRAIGYLTQEANLFPHLSVAGNVRFGRRHGVPAERDAWIDELRARLQLDPIWDAPAHAISGGQARRVALARMLARKPRLVLLDEPFAGLDRPFVRELIDAIDGWRRALGFILIVVDHQADVLERLCARVVAIEQGRVVQDGSWDELHRGPATPLLTTLLAPL